MATVSITEAAFAGFRLVRDRPKVIAIWAALDLVISLAFSTLFISAAGPALGKLQSLGVNPSPDPAQTLQIFQNLAPLYALLLPLTLIFYAIVYAAMNRAVLRPNQEGFAYLRLGMAELRQVGVMFLLGLVFMGVYLAALISLFVIGGILAVAIGAVAKGAVMFIVPVVAVVGLLVLFCGMIFVAVRLSLAPAQTFDTGRVNLFGSWTLTKGHFWSMFGAYLLMGVMLFAMLLVYLLLSLIVTFALGGGAAGIATMFRPDVSSLSTYFAPARLIPMIFSAIFSAIYLPVSLTPQAAIYKGLTARFGVTADGEAATLDSIFS